MHMSSMFLKPSSTALAVLITIAEKILGQDKKSRRMEREKERMSTLIRNH